MDPQITHSMPYAISGKKWTIYRKSHLE